MFKCTKNIFMQGWGVEVNGKPVKHGNIYISMFPVSQLCEST